MPTLSTHKLNWMPFNATYSTFEVQLRVPATQGIYLIWVKLQNGNWRCIYVGKAENLKSRLLDHLYDSEPNKKLLQNIRQYVCGFEYAQVGGPNLRTNIEKYLYDYYKPECNQIDPGGFPVSVNLP